MEADVTFTVDLKPMELDFLTLAAQGLDADAIAAKLGISATTAQEISRGFFLNGGFPVNLADWTREGFLSVEPRTNQHVTVDKKAAK